MEQITLPYIEEGGWFNPTNKYIESCESWPPFLFPQPTERRTSRHLKTQLPLLILQPLPTPERFHLRCSTSTQFEAHVVPSRRGGMSDLYIPHTIHGTNGIFNYMNGRFLCLNVGSYVICPSHGFVWTV